MFGQPKERRNIPLPRRLRQDRGIQLRGITATTDTVTTAGTPKTTDGGKRKRWSDPETKNPGLRSGVYVVCCNRCAAVARGPSLG